MPKFTQVTSGGAAPAAALDAAAPAQNMVTYAADGAMYTQTSSNVPGRDGGYIVGYTPSYAPSPVPVGRGRA